MGAGNDDVGAIKACLFAGVRAASRSAIGEDLGRLRDAEELDFFDGGGKAVIVCEVDVMEDDVLLLLAMANAAIFDTWKSRGKTFDFFEHDKD